MSVFCNGYLYSRSTSYLLNIDHIASLYEYPCVRSSIYVDIMIDVLRSRLTLMIYFTISNHFYVVVFIKTSFLDPLFHLDGDLGKRPEFSAHLDLNKV